MQISSRWFGHRSLAFVLGGGGARGALQVGALRALVEADIRPELMVGTSAGAVNAAFVALHGLTDQGLADLAAAWITAAGEDLLPANPLGLTARLLFDRARVSSSSRLREFYIRHGLRPDIRFGDLPGPRLFVVAADTNHGQLVLYGQDLKESVLEAVVASTALPPWVPPQAANGRLILDGGVVSNLPIEPALSLGATEIIALDVDDSRIAQQIKPDVGAFVAKLTVTAQQREKEMELAVARARRVPVHLIELQAEWPVALWDFGRTAELMERGFQVARQAITTRQLGQRSRAPSWLPWRRPAEASHGPTNTRGSARRPAWDFGSQPGGLARAEGTRAVLAPPRHS